MSKSEQAISIILVRSEINIATIHEFLDALNSVLEKSYNDFEIIIVDDSASEMQILFFQDLLKTIPNIRHLESAHDITYNTAVFIGLRHSIGDYIVITNPMRDSVREISNIIYQTISSKADLIIGVASNMKSSFIYKIFRKLSKKILKYIDYTLPLNTTSLRCTSRMLANTILQNKIPIKQILFRMWYICQNKNIYKYKISTPKLYKKTFLNSLQLNLDLLIFNSNKPLKWVVYLGCVGCFIALSVSTYAFVSKLVLDGVASGWASILMIISMLFMIQFVLSVFISETLKKIVSILTNDNREVVLNERSSSMMINYARKNVTK